MKYQQVQVRSDELRTVLSALPRGRVFHVTCRRAVPSSLLIGVVIALILLAVKGAATWMPAPRRGGGSGQDAARGVGCRFGRSPFV